MTDFAPLDPALAAELAARFGPGWSSRPEALSAAATDDSGLSATPEAVLMARDAARIADLLRLAAKHRFAVTPRGAGTGLSGGCVAAHGGVVLSTAAMNRILHIDVDNMIAVVEPGVVTATLRQAVRAKGLFYPPDPASLETCTLGGNAATNAGGPACVKYGVTRDSVLGLTAVLGSGETVETGSATRKHVVGYDLTRLLIGSEGTLGIITELTVKLIPHPRATAAMAALFPNPRAAVTAVSRLMTSGITPSAVELMDHRCLSLVRDELPFALPDAEAALLLLETDGSEAEARAAMAVTTEICRDGRALEILPAPDEARRQALWATRRRISTRIHEEAPVYLPEDVVVPLARIPDLIAALPDMERDFGLVIYAFGHAGDGNVHVNITGAEEGLRDAAWRCAERLMGLVLGLGGTISGEHGVGLAKKRFLPLEIGPESLAVQRAIKTLFDPAGVLNPGKLFP